MQELLNNKSTLDLSTIAIALYAAIVATGALALELRRWRESGARLVLSISPEMIRPSSLEHRPFRYIVANVTNRGDMPTTLTHLALVDYETRWNWLRGKEVWTVVVPRPEGGELPMLMEPGGQWVGAAKYGDDGELDRRRDGKRLYLMMHATHRNKPIMARVRTPNPPPTSTKDSSRSIC